MNIVLEFRKVPTDNSNSISGLMSVLRKVIIVLFFYHISILPQNNIKRGNLLESHPLYIFEGLGPTFTRTDYSEIGVRYDIKIGAEYLLKSFSNHAFGGRISVNLMELTASDPTKVPYTHVTDILSLNTGFLYTFRLNDKIYPYLTTGVSVTYFDPRDSNRDKLSGNKQNQYDKLTPDFYFEAGVKYRLSKNLLLFSEGSLYINDDDLLDDYDNNHYADFYGTLVFGISYAFNFNEDADDDGVPDEWDICPYTPAELSVDKYGCPIDNDIDGIPDYRDKCPDTPIGIPVDRFGCAFDNDNDLVPDYLDKCPDTPRNVLVDSLGCPLDTDRDGVPDYLDLCPDTEEGSKVDSTGCYKLDDSKNFIESIIIYFESGNADLDEQAESKLNKLVFYMNNYENIKWYIEGHKDRIERSSGEEDISLTRAKNVLDFLLRKGVSIKKLEIFNKGDGFSVADNNTIDGRSKNRRVVIFGIK
ncbi:MAG: OmpA family protein [Melioribacteraceae bacterium]|nr:OmpA family protein [Melioribacteraceae bacterium]